MNGSIRLALNGFEVWAYVVELDEGYRMRLSLDDWYASRFSEGRKIPVRMRGRADEWLFITNAVSLPPVVWVTVLKRMLVLG
jgi:hypothetical protein